ncbi:MAG: DUF1697 domain-containing protein [Comamonas sp.]
MPRYVAFLRGVSPMNAQMPALRRCFEAAGFTEVKTLLSSGNVVFTAPSSLLERLEQRAVNAMQSELGHSFDTFVRPSRYLQDLIDAAPFAAFNLAPSAKRVITFVRSPAEPDALQLPMEHEGATIYQAHATEVYSAYVPDPSQGPAFMRLLERTLGKAITTRTLDTVIKCAKA